ncbi:MAG: hypothetical protein AAF629_15820 [Chloroflexota bacterium]
MADVFAVFGTLLVLGIALPGLLLAWRLIFPKLVDRAQQRLVITPWRCFFMGVILMGVVAFALGLLFAIPGGGQALGIVLLLIMLTVASFGAAGLAELMGQRLRLHGLAVSNIGATVRGAIALELAAVFPVIGWFIVIPLTLVASFGAAIYALLRWQPRPKKADSTAQTTDDDITLPTTAVALGER